MTEELPVENVGDGDGTFIAGRINHHLDIAKAIDCTAARFYFAVAFMSLSDVDRDAYVAANNLHDLSIIVAFLVNDLDTPAGSALLTLNSLFALAATSMILYILNLVNNQIGSSDEAHQEYANLLDKRYKEHWQKE